MNKFEKHPIRLINKIISNENIDNVEFIFEKYIDGERDNTISRETNIRIVGNQLTEFWLEKSLQGLGSDEELGFTSKIKIGNTYKYIPLIDFKTEKSKYDELKSCLEKTRLNNIHIYFSGSSYHGYLPELLEKDKLDKFFAKILLLGSSEEVGSIVDLRWLGHSLNRGKSVLRWSNNRKKHLPEFVTIINKHN